MISQERVLVEKLKCAKEGDLEARNQVISASKPFVFNVVSSFCQRKLEWGRDDELSIGLIALDEAIDRYHPDRQIPFLAYARIVIKSRLKDYFRQESKHDGAVPLEEATAADGTEYHQSLAEAAHSWDNYIQQTAERERREEVIEFGRLLNQFGLDYQALVAASPKHRDTRENLIRVAWQLSRDPQLINQLLEKKRLPMAELVRQTGVKRKTLERGRRYIIALAILFYYKERFIYMYSYLKLTDWGRGEG